MEEPQSLSTTACSAMHLNYWTGLPKSRIIQPCFPISISGRVKFPIGTNRMDDAIPYFFEYLKAPVSRGEVSPKNARYDLGYCYLKKENYQRSTELFFPGGEEPGYQRKPSRAGCLYPDGRLLLYEPGFQNCRSDV